MAFDYMTIKDGYILEFCGYRVAGTPEKAVTGNKTFEKRMNALANGLAFGDTTAQYRNAKGNSKWEIAKSFTFSIWILILPLLYILLCGMKVSSSDYYPDDMTYAVLKKKGVSGNPGIYVLLLLATLPPLIVYILFAKNIMGRIALGAVKE